MYTLIEKTVEAAAYRISQAERTSIAIPSAIPCTAAMTGCGTSSIAEMQLWNCCNVSGMHPWAGRLTAIPSAYKYQIS